MLPEPARGERGELRERSWLFEAEASAAAEHMVVLDRAFRPSSWELAAIGQIRPDVKSFEPVAKRSKSVVPGVEITIGVESAVRCPLFETHRTTLVGQKRPVRVAAPIAWKRSFRSSQSVLVSSVIGASSHLGLQSLDFLL